MGINLLLKNRLLSITKVISFIVIILIVQRIVFVPLSAISRKYWSQFDGRGLNEPWFLSTSISIGLIAVFICFIFLRFIDKKSWSYLRIMPGKFIKYLVSGFFISFSIVIGFTVINLIVGNTELSLHLSSFPDIVLYSVILFAGISAIVLYEELVYRGYILKTLEVNFNKTVAVIFSSILFSGIHFLRPDISFLSVTNIFLAGLVLSVACIYYNSLWVPLAIHLGWNFSLWFFNYPISSQRWTNPIFKLDYHNNNLISGTAFGPEDSLLTTIIIVIALGYFLLKIKKKPKLINAA